MTEQGRVDYFSPVAVFVRFIALILYCIYSMSSARAATPASAVPIELNQKFDFSGAQYFEETEHPMSFEQAREQFRRGSVRIVESKTTILGYFENPVWLHFSLEQPNTLTPRYLIFLATWYRTIQQYTVSPDGLVSLYNWGFSADQPKTFVPALPLPLDIRVHDFYLRLDSKEAMSIAAHVGSMELAIEDALINTSAGVFYSGVLLVLIFYHCVLFFALRHKIYITYLAFAFSMLSVDIAYSGLLDALFPATDRFFVGISGYVRCFTAPCMLWFGYELLRLGESPRWRLFCQILFVSALAGIILVVFNRPLGLYFNDFINVLFFIFTAASAIRSMRHKDPVAGIYLASILALGLGVAVWTAGNLGLIEQNGLVFSAPVYGGTVEILLLSFALSSFLKAQRVAAESNLNRADLLTRFLRILSHDISNPLAVARGWTEHLSELVKETVATNPKAELALNRIHRSLIKVEDILTHVRRALAVEGGKYIAALEKVDLEEAVRDTALDFEQALQKKELRLEIAACSERFYISAERTPLGSEILGNLLSNAIKFSPTGSELKIAFRRLDNGQVELKLIDQGVGITQSLQSQIFDPKARTSTLGTAGEGGTGFGMPLVKQFLDIYGASIRVESRAQSETPPPHGTTFILQFLPWDP